ncbi:hypothetical protein HDV00_003317 [Rhizophlyctis rosea]|nr:hypothetical protein HDV00_003317 [Rhizophlyctis rosea]
MTQTIPFSSSTTTWHNPPSSTPTTSFPLSYHTPSPTDAWYTPLEHRDNAPTLQLTQPFPASQPFTITAHFNAPYKTLYDQAGISIRHSPTAWIKAGIEFYENEVKVSTVVTNGFSDWSIQPYSAFLEPGQQTKDGYPLWIRAVRKEKGGEVMVEASIDRTKWKLIRHCFGWDKEVQVGIVSAAPTQSGGFTVTFDHVKVEA